MTTPIVQTDASDYDIGGYVFTNVKVRVIRYFSKALSLLVLVLSKGYTYILVIIDAFSRWVELFPTTSVCAYETCSNISADSILLQRYTRIEGLLSTLNSRDLLVRITVFHGVFDGGEWHRRARQLGSH